MPFDPRARRSVVPQMLGVDAGDARKNIGRTWNRSQPKLDARDRPRSISNMRWDDLQILKAIDEYEDSVGPVSDGLRLMDTYRAGQQLDYRKDPPAFAH